MFQISSSVVDLGSGLGFLFVSAFGGYFDFALESLLIVAFRVGLGTDSIANILSSCYLGMFL